ncbi:amino acid adenylation domain-containing protein [Bacteroides helcogenes]|uniref:AMP-dependent synthetase and ligase n=1 Tax=Bacteroides helcogenes (strain ATCC 35417 / DSM 20613 / JCM 6297 / CCUG 15421 / P 36-108) TaxID=693979 RepID=E6SQ31_BACT6|nr:amino acid adenylation domain-containing protein [Bacteroides helcogenes]ADV42936.1 AMP-dependent synthetase and ligase [Bacteroides helcogenes P 36-108]MDY5237021.1 amino acid adenylation domain-containing protein [Bacteroides helcogenes]
MKENQNDLINDIAKAFGKYAPKHAFVIDDIAYTYEQLSATVCRIAARINDKKEKIVGIVAENKLETYASILAVLISGRTYVILHPAYPKQRNKKIAEVADIHLVLYSEDIHILNLDTRDVELICTSNLPQPSPTFFPHIHTEENENAYIIFTSGSTGEPKGVPISRSNLNAFYAAYSRLGWILNENDRMLQMFELTFDVSIVSYLYPLTLGACIYTISPDGVKYINVAEVLEKYSLTFATVAPSLLRLLRPYFSEINLPELKYLVVTAEASEVELLSAFRKCAPNASFVNLYGPTEGTIYCTAYPIPMVSCKHHNGMIAIGKPFDGVNTLIMSDDSHLLSPGETGELWISGKQVMKSYWNSPQKSKESLVETADGKIYYKTGDLCRMDSDGDIIYCGRKDSQIKIQGFRVELSEIEHVVKNFFKGECKAVVIPKYTENSHCELHLIIERVHYNKQQLEEYMSSRLPFYMIPKQIHCLEQFPLNTNSKTDIKKIKELI